MPDNLFQSRAAEVVLKSYLKAKQSEEEERKRKANERLAIYHDDWEDILESTLSSQFHKDNYAKIKLLKNTTQNILRKVVDDVSVVYKIAPVREYGENEKIGEIYQYLEIDEFMKRVNQYGFLLNDVLIRVGWDQENQKVTLDLHTPANTSIIQRDNYPEQAAAVYYEVEYIDTEFNPTKFNVFWSDFEHFLFDEKGIIYSPTEDNQEKINPYGQLPFVIVHMKPFPGMFWNTSLKNDIVSGTVITGFKRTLKDYLFKHSSFKQPVINADNIDKIPNELLHDVASAWKIQGQNANVSLLDFTANFSELSKTIQEDINAFLSTYGLSVDMFAVSPSEASGRALQIKNRGLQEIREAQIPIFRRVEKQLFDMIRIVYNWHSSSSQIPELDFSIDFAELETYTDPMEERKQFEWDLKRGVISPGQFYMAFNPDVTDAETAEKIMAENLKKYKDMKNQGFSFDDFFGNKEAPNEDSNE